MNAMNYTYGPETSEEARWHNIALAYLEWERHHPGSLGVTPQDLRNFIRERLGMSGPASAEEIAQLEEDVNNMGLHTTDINAN